MTPARALRELTTADQRRTRARDALVEAESRLGAAVETALGAGVSATEIAATLGVTRGRVYQLRTPAPS